MAAGTLSVLALKKQTFKCNDEATREHSNIRRSVMSYVEHSYVRRVLIYTFVF